MQVSSSNEYRSIVGACHCGNIGFDLRWPQSVTDILVRRCGCSFCQKHGGAWTSHHDASLVVAVEDRSRVSEYRFGTNTAEFYVCARCGAVPFVLSEIDGRLHAVVNVNAFEDTEGISLSGMATNFDGEEVADRLERRKRYWIPDVRLKQK